jgi:DNA (cytosine-5)-methyltransferase 1
MYNAKTHADLIPDTRTRLSASGIPWVIENVEGAPLLQPVTLCGSMFELVTDNAELRRHRLFESVLPIAPLRCRHKLRDRVIGVYGGHGRDRRRTVNTQDFSVADRKLAMGIDWMTGHELSQAIPPEYSEYIGRQIVEYLR